MRAGVVALFVVLLPAVVEAQAPFTEEVHVTAIELTAQVLDSSGKTPRDLQAQDFVVVEDGIERAVTSLEYLGELGLAAASTPQNKTRATAAAAPKAKKWNIVIYVDLEMSGFATTRAAMKALTKEAERLARLGTVELVVVDPSPRRILAPTTDPVAVRNALTGAERMPARDRFTRIRRDFIDQMAFEGVRKHRPKYQKPGDVRGAINEERQLIQQFNDRLGRFLAGYPRNTANALLLVSDGFDVDPLTFYGQTLGGSGMEAMRMRGELSDRNARVADSTARQAAATGWTVVTLSGGLNVSMIVDSSVKTGHKVANFYLDSEARMGTADRISFAPRDVLHGLAQETGGSVEANPANFGRAIESLGNRVRITYQVSRPADAQVRRVELVAKRANLNVTSTRWITSSTPELTAAARATTLLNSELERGDLPLAASLDLSDDAPKGIRHGALEVRLALHPIETLRQQLTNATLRVTVAVESPRDRPLIIHQVLRDRDLSINDVLTFTAPFHVMEKTHKVAVVIEELSSGAWGGATISVQPSVKAARAVRR
jgi:hypothetical protein